MKLTERLLNNLHRVFDKDPKAFLALRLSHAGNMTWSVSEMRLQTTVSGAPDLDIDLTLYTLNELVAFLSVQTDYSVSYVDPDRGGLSARLLLDASGDPAASNGDHIYGYTSLLWAFLEAFAVELTYAQEQVAEAPEQLDVNKADGFWLDEIGAYYDVRREPGEIDALYGPRIIAETIRPKSNNVAIAQAIEAYTGQAVDVVDVVEVSGGVHFYDGTYTHDGTIDYDTATTTRYSLFDIIYGYDIISGGTFAEFQAAVRSIVGRLRAAGTHLRSLTLASPAVSDAYTSAVTDVLEVFDFAMALADTLDSPVETLSALRSVSTFGDTADEPTEDSTLTITDGRTYSGAFKYDGTQRYTGGTNPTSTIEG